MQNTSKMNIRLSNHTVEMLVFGDPKLDETRRLLKENGLLDWVDNVQGDMHFSWNNLIFEDRGAVFLPKTVEEDKEKERLMKLEPARKRKDKYKNKSLRYR
jgi:hypothetical protein